MNVCAKPSLFSVNAVRIRPRSWRRTTRRGTTAAAATSHTARYLTPRRARSPRRTQGVGQRQSQLDDLAVEERRAELEGVRHRREIGLREQVAGEVGLEVGQLQPDHSGTRWLEPHGPSLRRVGPELAPQLER